MTRRAVWYLVEVEDAVRRNVIGEGKKLRFLVTNVPSWPILAEERTVDEVAKAAADKGFEVVHASSLTTPRFELGRLEARVLAFLRTRYRIENRFDVVIEPVLRSLKYEEVAE